jgi:hypothetical protein
MNRLERRLAVLINRGYTQVTADDVTDCGKIAIDQGHSPNGKQSGIGSFFRQKVAEGILAPSGLPPVRSQAPKRKGGMIQVWLVTPKGRSWASHTPDDPPKRTLVRV